MKFLLALAGAILTQSLVGQTSGEAKTPSPSPLAAEARFDHTLSGDWGGARSALADHGLSLDLRYTQFFDGLLAGDLRSDAAFGSRIDAMLTLDTGKLGLWHLRMPDGTSRGPFCSRKLARKSITFYRREWQAKIAAAELAKTTPAPKRRKEVAPC